MNEIHNHSREIRVAFQTLGCRLNQYDTEVMKSRLPEHLHCRIVSWDDAADVYVINSCTVTGKADQKCRQLARRIRRQQPDAKIVVTGCYAQTQPEILEAMPELDGIIGLTDRDNIAEWLPRLLVEQDRIIEVSQYSKRLEFQPHSIADFEGRTRAYVKIQDGCNLRCTYCLIWKARGPGRSRQVDEVLQQIAILEQKGFREIVLTGVHMGSYGRDLGWKPGLLGLTSRIASAFPNLRFRLSSLHPNEITDEFLDVFKQYSNIQPYLHISMQSGSDDVLERMKRPYSAAQVDKAVHAAAKLHPHFGIGADVIVGFPEETDEEFEQTRRMIEEAPFSYLHVFRYSNRPGTKAAAMSDVHNKTMTERSSILRKLSQEKRHIFESRLIDAGCEAIVETHTPSPGRIQATTGHYATVLVPDSWEPGTLITVRPHAFENGVLIADDVHLLQEPHAAGAES